MGRSRKGEAVAANISQYELTGFPNGDWESETPPSLREAVANIRSLAEDGFIRINSLLRKEEQIRAEPLSFASFTKSYEERRKAGWCSSA
jgi:hypothetical protein